MLSRFVAPSVPLTLESITIAERRQRVHAEPLRAMEADLYAQVFIAFVVPVSLTPQTPRRPAGDMVGRGRQ